jgi:hypothetical protein
MVAIEHARQQGHKLICFVTGVPGSGKTLAGLNIIHSRELHEGSLGVFLSGNGPLVKVLSEALARDHSERTGESIAESRRRVSTFVQNVHRFIDPHFTSSPPPPDRVVVFDEAWTFASNWTSKTGSSTRVPTCDRHTTWKRRQRRIGDLSGSFAVVRNFE